jgi:hypothetical protein
MFHLFHSDFTIEIYLEITGNSSISIHSPEVNQNVTDSSNCGEQLSIEKLLSILKNTHPDIKGRVQINFVNFCQLQKLELSAKSIIDVISEALASSQSEPLPFVAIPDKKNSKNGIICIDVAIPIPLKVYNIDCLQQNLHIVSGQLLDNSNLVRKFLVNSEVITNIANDFPTLVTGDVFDSAIKLLSTMHRLPINKNFPSPYPKPVGSKIYKGISPPEIGLAKLISQRRTTRHFSDQPIRTCDFWHIVNYTFGPWNDSQKYLASAGGLNSLEIRLIIIGQSDFSDGLYELDRCNGDISFIQSVPQVEYLSHLQYSMGPHSYPGSGVLFLFSTQNSIFQKYGLAGIRLSTLETGMAIEIISLLSVELSLGSVILGGITEPINFMLNHQWKFNLGAIYMGIPKCQN